LSTLTKLPRTGTARGAGQTIPARVVHVLGLRPDAVALRWSRGDSWSTWSFAEMVARAQAVAGSLRSLGVAPGDRVLMLLRNQPEFHIADLAAQFLRATPISVYWTASAEQIVDMAAHSEAKVAIVADHLGAERFARAQSDVPTLRELVVVDDEERAAASSAWRDLLRGELVDLEASAASVRPEDLATVMYTSGTTGAPKGVMISQANICWTMDCLKKVYAPLELDKARLVSYLPMAHVAERMTTHYPLLAFGTEITCCPEPSAFVDYLP
jgi:long-chain acyl-CoA synthetase